MYAAAFETEAMGCSRRLFFMLIVMSWMSALDRVWAQGVAGGLLVEDVTRVELPVMPNDYVVPSCSAEDVVPKVGKHVGEFVQNVNRYTATEVVRRERLNADGKVRDTSKSRANYVASIEEDKKGYFSVREYRSRSQEEPRGPEWIEANIAPSLVLIFHPTHSYEFAMTCEGPGDWNGHRAWQIHFAQRADRPATFAEMMVNRDSFALQLKGTAWVDCDSFQILHMETGLMQSMPMIRLDELSQSVDYGPVVFSNGSQSMWLPWTAKVTAEFKGKRLVARHTYSDFRLFMVDTGEKIGQPAAAAQN
jgi:hypothetical protein